MNSKFSIIKQLCWQDYNKVLDICNEIFKAAIRKCYNDFVVIGKSIIDRIEVNGMVGIYKDNLRNYYNEMFPMLGFDK